MHNIMEKLNHDGALGGERNSEKRILDKVMGRFMRGMVEGEEGKVVVGSKKRLHQAHMSQTP
jgi:hypothetical protein